MKLLASNAWILALSLSFAHSAYSQVSLTPKAGHVYKKVKMESRVSGSIDNPFSGVTETFDRKESTHDYANTHTFQLELASSLTDDIEVLTNLGYAPIYAPGGKVDVWNFDVGVRSGIENLYGQASVGLEQYKSDFDDSLDYSFVMPTAGIGAGYLIPVGDGVSVDIFYRGRLTLAESKSKSEEFMEGAKVSYKFASVETHELGLGLKIDIK